MSTNSYIDVATIERCETECICPELVMPLIGRVATATESESIAETFSLLSDPTRLRLLHALSLSGELCVCDLAFLTGTSQSAVSHQLRSLRTSGVVTRRKEGRSSFYALSDDLITEMLRRHVPSHVRTTENA